MTLSTQRLSSNAMQIFDGVMLSDAGLRKYKQRALLHLSQSGTEHFDWLKYVRDESLIQLNVPISDESPRFYKSVSKGKSYVFGLLSTKLSSFLFEQYERWYPNNKKAVPVSLSLTPLCLANWYMGDGHASNSENGNTHQVCLSPMGFSDDGIDMLKTRLDELLGVNVGITKAREIRFMKDADVFMSVIEPFMVDSFRYKIKYSIFSGKRLLE